MMQVIRKPLSEPPVAWQRERPINERDTRPDVLALTRRRETLLTKIRRALGRALIAAGWRLLGA